MPHFEVIYETGAHSVISAPSDEEAMVGIAEHHRRAVNGDNGGPAGQPAERVKAVLCYDEHPGNFGSSDTMSADVASKELAALVKSNTDENGVVNIGALSSAVRGLSDPHDMDAVNESRHNSQYKMKEKKSLPSSMWEGGE